MFWSMDLRQLIVMVHTLKRPSHVFTSIWYVMLQQPLSANLANRATEYGKHHGKSRVLML